jgi:hypothetical protein
MNITYIKLLQAIESFASAHLQIERFGADFPGQMPNFGNQSEGYPILFVSPSATIFDTNSTKFEIEVFCFDIIQKDRANINSILSDTNSILNDLDKWFREGNIYGIDLMDATTAEPLNNRLLDYAAGHSIKLVLDVNSYTICEIPFANAPVVVTEVCDIVYSQYLTCETLSGCSVIDSINTEINDINIVISGLTGSTPSENVYFDSINPNLSGTTFTPDQQQFTDTLYISENLATAGQTWIWNGSVYTGYTGTTIASTPFLIYGTSIDAGSNKTAMINHRGGVAATSFNTQKTLTNTSATNHNKWWKIFDYNINANYMGDSFKVQMNEFNTSNGGGKSVIFDIVLKRQDPSVYLSVNVESGLSSFDLSNFDVLYNSTTKRLSFFYKPLTTYTYTNWLVLNAKATTTSEIVWYNSLIGASLTGQTSNAMTSKVITLNKINGAYTLPSTAPSIGQTIGYLSAGTTTWVNQAVDIHVTGGTYTAGTATFTNNTGGTFNVSGFFTGSTSTQSNVVFFDTINPNLSGTTFDPDYQMSGDTLYVSQNIATPSFTWIWDGSVYTGFTGTSTSNTAWNLAGTSIDAGANKSAAISRSGSTYVGYSTGLTSNVRFGVVGTGGIMSFRVFENNAIAEGQLTTASGVRSHAEGYLTVASGNTSHAEGSNTVAGGNYSHSEGVNTKALGAQSHAEGSGSQSNGNTSHAEGIYTNAFGNYSHAEGNGNYAGGESSHAQGIGTSAMGDASHTEGDGTQADGYVAHAEGFSTVASGNQSHAEGTLSQAIGAQSHAEGYNTIASGNTSHAEGDGSIAGGAYSHAQGYRTTSNGNGSHTEGIGTFASGDAAHAEGENTSAIGNYSHAEGYATQAVSFFTHAGGRSSIANGLYSFVHGFNSYANGQSTVVLGENLTGNTANTVYTNALNIKTIGSGTSVTNLGWDASGNIVSGGTSSVFTGGTVSGATSFTNGLTATTISATTYLGLPTDIRVTGGTYSAGTALFTNNTGGTFSVSGFSTGGGLTYFTESQLTSTPNNTVYVSALSAVGTTTNVDIAILPKGNGAIIASTPNNIVTVPNVGGNKRGQYALDLQHYGTINVNTEVASGNYAAILAGSRNTASNDNATVLNGFRNSATGAYSTVINGQINASSGLYSITNGQNNTANGTYAIALGFANQANSNYGFAGGFSCQAGNSSFAYGQYCYALGTYAFAFGNNNQASADSSTSLGIYANSFNIKTKFSLGTNGSSYSSGTSQKGQLVLTNLSTSSAATELAVSNVINDARYNLTLQDNQAMRVKGSIIGKQTASLNVAAFDFDYVIVRGVGAGTTTIVSSNINTVTNIPAWGTPTITADTTRGYASIKVIGSSSGIRWTASIDSTEIIYA